MAGVISVVSSKGGAGKSTLSVHLTGRLLETSPTRPLVVVDSDPQAHTFSWLAECAPTVTVERCTDAETLLGQIPLWGADADMEAEDTDEHQPARVIVDCAGGDSDVMRQVIGRSDVVVIPLAASSLDLEAASSTWRIVQLIKDLRDDEKRPHTIFAPSRWTKTKVADEVLSSLEEFEEQILSPAIPQRAIVADSAGQKAFVWDMPGGREVGDVMREACDAILATVKPKPYAN